MTDFAKILRALERQGAHFIIVGGMAAVVHGSSRLTQDLDLVYERSTDNLARLIAALETAAPYLRGAPPGLPFDWSAQTLKMGLNFTLTTAWGALDLLGEITGGGDYHQLKHQCIEIELFGTRCLCLGLEALIQAKRAAGRPKDLESVAELEAILAERNQNG